MSIIKTKHVFAVIAAVFVVTNEYAVSAEPIIVGFEPSRIELCKMKVDKEPYLEPILPGVNNAMEINTMVTLLRRQSIQSSFEEVTSSGVLCYVVFRKDGQPGCVVVGIQITAGLLDVVKGSYDGQRTKFSQDQEHSYYFNSAFVKSVHEKLVKENAAYVERLNKLLKEASGKGLKEHLRIPETKE